MEFQTRMASGREVLFVGHEQGNSKAPEDWLVPGRWKISLTKLASYLTGQLQGKSFGVSVERFVFCFEIADFELWKHSFQVTAEYAIYRPNRKEYWSVGQLRWSDVKLLDAGSQLDALRTAIQTAIRRVGQKPRKPRDFDYISFAAAVDSLLAGAPEGAFLSEPAVAATSR
jgi:hypothetical protein